jgi:hypothetical protein
VPFVLKVTVYDIPPGVRAAFADAPDVISISTAPLPPMPAYLEEGETLTYRE